MKKILAASILTMLMITYATAQVACITFNASVDGSDWIKIENGQLTMVHRNWQPITTIKIDDVSHTTSKQANDTYLIDGAAYLSVPIQDLDSFTKNIGRGTVSWSGTHRILVDDDSYGGGSTYSISLCGTPTTTTTTSTTTTTTSTTTTTTATTTTTTSTTTTTTEPVTTTTLISVPEFGTGIATLVVLLTAPGFAYLIARKRE